MSWLGGKSVSGSTICKLCLEEVINPICISCLSLSVNQWIRKENEELFSEFIQQSSKVFDFLAESEDNIEYCIKCHNYNLKVLCQYCYTHLVYKVLESINWIKAEKFKIVFNYNSENSSLYEEEIVRLQPSKPPDIVDESIIDICDDCGAPTYFAEGFESELRCNRCITEKDLSSMLLL